MTTKYDGGPPRWFGHPFISTTETFLINHLERCWFYGHLDKQQKAMYDWAERVEMESAPIKASDYKKRDT